MKLLTNLLFEPKGMHNPALAYNIKDTVMSADGSRVYFALQDVPAGIALDNGDYWKLQIDLSGSKSAMDQALVSFADYAKVIGMRVRGETAGASGNPVTFLPDAGSLLQPVTVLEPQQEGSGDPYPAGGGRNLLNNTATTQTINGVTFTINADGGVHVKGTTTADNTFLNLNYVNASTSFLSAGDYILSGAPGTALVLLIVNGIWNTYANKGAEKTFTIGEGITNSWVRIQIDHAGTTLDETLYPMVRRASDPDATYAPPSNIRPFIGYDKLDLDAAGKNLLPNLAATHSESGVTFTVNPDGSITINGTATAQIIYGINLTSVYLPAGEYIATNIRNGVNEKYYVTFYSKPDSSARIDIYANDKSFVLADGDCVRNFRIVVRAGAVLENLTFYPMIRRATIADATYTPYQGNLHTVQIGQTVYGGRFNWLTGKLVAEWVMKTLDGGPWEAAGFTNPYAYAWWGAFSDVVEYGQSDVAEVYCSHYIAKSVDEIFYNETPGVALFSSGGSLVISSPTHATVDAFKAALAASPVQIAHKLANPIEIQLTPHIISAADPEQTNTLYGDGRIDVEYVKPLHVSIEERVAAAVAAAKE